MVHNTTDALPKREGEGRVRVHEWNKKKRTRHQMFTKTTTLEFMNGPQHGKVTKKKDYHAISVPSHFQKYTVKTW